MPKTNSKEIFETFPVPRAVKAMALPTIFGQIIILIYNMADTFFVGRVNNPYMVAGASLILPVFNICLALAGLCGVGGGALISRLLGEGREDEARKISSFSFYLSLIMTGIFSVAVFAFMKPLLEVLGASDDTFMYARQYAFCVIVLGGVPTVMSNVLSNLLRSVGVSKAAGIGVTMGGLINIALDPLFMFVILPEGKEVLGVGIATLISNCIACTYFFIIIYRLRKQSVINFRLKNILPSGQSVKSLFNVGVPSAITTLLFDIDYIVIDKLMSGYHDVALAAIGIVLKAERLPLNVGIGICQGMMPIVAYNYASGNRKRMNDTIKFSVKVGIIVSIVSITLYEILAGGIMRVFIPDAETVLLGTGFLRIRCLATPLMFLSFFTVHTFQGFGKGNIALFLGVVRWAVFNIPMLFLLNRIFGMYGIVWSQVTADTLTVALSAFVYFRYTKKSRISENF